MGPACLLLLLGKCPQPHHTCPPPPGPARPRQRIAMRATSARAAAPAGGAASKNGPKAGARPAAAAAPGESLELARWELRMFQLPGSAVNHPTPALLVPRSRSGGGSASPSPRRHKSSSKHNRKDNRRCGLRLWSLDAACPSLILQPASCRGPWRHTGPSLPHCRPRSPSASRRRSPSRLPGKAASAAGEPGAAWFCALRTLPVPLLAWACCGHVLHATQWRPAVGLLMVCQHPQLPASLAAPRRAVQVPPA
jgi:hypothetical protein